MASEAVVSFVVGKLGDLLIDETRFLYEVGGQIEDLESRLKDMQRFLKDADAKDADAKQKGHHGVSKRVEDIRALSYDAEDIIDSFILAQRSRRALGGVKSHICIVPELRTRHKIGKRIQGITKRIAEITDEMKTNGIVDIPSSSLTNLNERRRHFAQNEHRDTVVGQEEIQRSMTYQLLNDEAKRRVISIVGMGGLGKTTIAKKVYNDIKGKFRHHAFIYLSKQYIISEVLTRIIESVMSQLSKKEKEEMEISNEENESRKLVKLLSKKRYLVVIDDIWTADAWNDLKHSLPDDSNKSRVMLTTRCKEVALLADDESDPSDGHLHHISILSKDDPWKLFLTKICPDGSVCRPDLEELGRKIVERCDGLPLDIVVLGGLLKRKRKDHHEWSKVLASVPWHLAQQTGYCMKILALSYYDLPPYLKPCFLYLGLFPEDFEIRSHELIRLWVAEGFIGKRGQELIEDIAEDYLEELIDRSMIQVTRQKYNGSASRCRIHDLLRELCISEAKAAKFFEIDGDNGDNGTTSSSTNVRRLALYRSIGENDTTIQSAALRSMLYFSKSKTNFSKLLNRGGDLLRVLHADIDDGSHEKDLPKKIGAEGYLRYLRFSGIQSLPSSIGNLSDLQTIILTESRYSGILPNTIWKLKKLRHLYAYRWKIDGHPRLSELINLQTLCLRAGDWIKDGLDKLTNLRKLGILGNLRSYQEALSIAVEKLCNLRSLKLSYSFSIPPFTSFEHHQNLDKMFLDGRIENLPESMPPNLFKLTLYESQLQKAAIVTLEKLGNLRILRLNVDSYCNEEIICSSSGFPQLESLELNCANPKHWVIEEGAMQSLKRVKLGPKTNWETVPRQFLLLMQS